MKWILCLKQHNKLLRVKASEFQKFSLRTIFNNAFRILQFDWNRSSQHYKMMFSNLSYRINVIKTNITASNWLKHELFLIACKILLRTMDEAAEMCDWATSWLMSVCLSDFSSRDFGRCLLLDCECAGWSLWWLSTSGSNAGFAFLIMHLSEKENHYC